MPETLLLIPHYADPEGLKRTLSSVKEDEPPFVLVVDDGSPECPSEEELKEAFPHLQLKLLRLPEN
ncbi:MAG: glycosyltransferase family 2 protein, partial [Aquificae bacterium]|nr:glycosyltransferase family 2 protein [Aquificota bacterium]